jgi:hypothetical protein
MAASHVKKSIRAKKFRSLETKMAQHSSNASMGWRNVSSHSTKRHCSFFNTPTGCRSGSSCRFFHQHSNSMNNKSAPMGWRNGSSHTTARHCSFFDTPMGCRNGSSCRFVHDVTRVHIPRSSQSMGGKCSAMIILVGIPGSGKSHFAEALQTANSNLYVRINQDTLGSRRQCEVFCHSVIRDGKCPIIDRCNFDDKQRQHFLQIATRLGIPVDCIEFRYSIDECIQRCQQRKGHETLSAQDAPQVWVTFIA